MKNCSLFITVLLLFSSFSFAQNTTNKWYFGLGLYATDHTSVQGLFDNYFNVKDYSFSFPKITAARSIAKNLAVDMQFSTGRIKNKRLNIGRKDFILAGIGLKYSPFSESNISKYVDLYGRIGGDYHKFSYKEIFINESHPHYIYNSNGEVKKEFRGKFTGKNNHFVLNGGIGINFWITKHIGLNIESQYNWVTDYSKNYANFFQHSASVVFKVGISDKDKDGILDKDDRCIDIAGLTEFQGCPDTDGDGIPDIDDQCPNEAGPKENNGCPWPDRDGDGILDKDDRCPDISGLTQFQGCPDTDHDGIPDYEDKCPYEAGLKENDGCPKIETTIAISEYLKNILFEFNSDKLTQESLPLVEKAADIIKDPSLNDKKFYIDGHTDRKGTNAINNIISKQRAQTVVNELVKKGIAKNRLTARGFGKSKPICSQEEVRSGKISQEECDQKNRRVEVLDRETEKQVELKK